MKHVSFLDLKKQFLSIRGEVDAALEDVFERSHFILGENVKRFEGEFAAYSGCKYGVGVGSGTDALHLALVSCGIGYGDEVITTPNTAVPTALAISAAGAKPVFVDVDPTSCTLDPKKLRSYLERQSANEALSRGLKAVIPVHLYGHPADMDPINELAKEFDLHVIEDCAQAHGAEYKGRKVGSIGDVGCFSFYPTKNLGAYGDGGMVVSNDEKIADSLRLLRNCGAESKYSHPVKGYNSRLDELQAALLRVKLQRLEQWNDRRNKLAAEYSRLLKGSCVVLPHAESWAKHVYHLFVIRSPKRDELQRYLEKNGVATLIHYPVPIHLQGAYQDLGVGEGLCPVAEQCAREVLSLPLYPEIDDDDIHYVAKVIRDFSSR